MIESLIIKEHTKYFIPPMLFPSKWGFKLWMLKLDLGVATSNSMLNRNQLPVAEQKY